MYSAGPFNSVPMGFQYPGQAPIYQPPPPPYGGYNPQVQVHYQQQPTSRGHSLPATMRQYPPTNGHYPRQYEQYPPPSSPRQYEQYPPPSSSRRYEYPTKKYHKQPTMSPINTPDRDLYSDKEKSIPKSSDERSRSQSKIDEINNPQSPAIENLNNEESQHDTNDNEEQQQQQQISQEKPKRKSRSRRKKHQRYEQYNPPFYTELPPHARVHQQPLYNNYNQPYDESIRRPNNIYHKPQQQPYTNGHSTYNPYQSYPAPPSHHRGHGRPQHWSHLNGNQNSSEREVQRLRQRIQTLEDQLNKLQKKFKKVSLTNTETSGQEEKVRKHRRTKRDRIRSPRQTPVIVELNSTTNETLGESSKKHRHRTASNNSSNQTTQSEKNSTDKEQVDSRTNGTHQHVETEIKNTHEENSTHIPTPPPVQQNIFPSHGQPSNNIHYPNASYQQPQQRVFLHANYNQSNNNEIIDPNEEQRTRAAERILDAFERFYIHTGRSPLTPIKVKFIPEEISHKQNISTLT